MRQVFQPDLFTMQSAAAEIHDPLPEDNEYGQQTGVWETLRLARTLGQKLSQFAPGMTKQEQDVLLKRLYFGQAETVQAASASGLITIGTEADKPVEPVFLMTPSLVANHTDLHRSLHQSKKHLGPPSRYDKYTQARQMFTLAKAIHDDSCDCEKDLSISKWESFLGSEQVSNDHACQPSMGMFTRSQHEFEGYPSYVIPHLDFPYPVEVTENPKDKDYLKSCLTGYDKDLTKVNSDLRKCLSNVIFVDMTEAALEDLKVPSTLPDFLAWKKAEDINMSNAE